MASQYKSYVRFVQLSDLIGPNIRLKNYISKQNKDRELKFKPIFRRTRPCHLSLAITIPNGFEI